jgi:toxin YoeB
MIYTVRYSKEADKTLAKFKKSNPAAHKKALDIIKDLHEHPRTGTGHPEPLKGGRDITYSRRLTAHERIIYNIYDDKIIVLILSVEGHYDDK